MDFKTIIKSMIGRKNIIIKEYFRNKVIYQGHIKKIPLEILNREWLVAEVLLTDKENYNSDYIITIY